MEQAGVELCQAQIKLGLSFTLMKCTELDYDRYH